MNILCIIFASIWTTSNAVDQLIFVHIVWQDGQHIPTETCKEATNKWSEPPGQLTVEGMRQHQVLGDRLHKRYAVDQKLISNKYVPQEVYIRTSDVNRTITSAASHMIGMYYNSIDDKIGLDFPNTTDWPSGYVPVPIHMIQKETDYHINPNFECKRKSYLQELLKRSPEYQTFIDNNQASWENLEARCGQSLDMLNSYFLTDTYKLEHFENLSNFLATSEYLLVYKAANLGYGIGVSSVDDIDLTKELPKAQTGLLLWDIINRMDLKIHCEDQANIDNSECSWIRNLKYYAYSVTEMTINSLLTTLGAPTNAELVGTFPEAATLMFELWITDSGPEVRMYYTGPLMEEIIELSLEGCGETGCKLDDFRSRSLDYDPGDIIEFCNDVPVSWSQPSLPVQEISQMISPSRITGRIHKRAADKELVFLQIIWRHGDRYPKEVCPNDPNKSWRKGYGQLSPIGMSQLQLLGSLIYDEYYKNQSFLSETYNPNEMYVRSTDVNRTITSAISNMIGMYYKKGDQNGTYPIDNDNGWPQYFVPIPIHTVDDNTDYIGDPHVSCPRKDDLVAVSLNTPEIFSVIKDNQDFLDEISGICGKKVEFLDLSVLIDAWESEKIYNRTPIFDDDQYNRMKELSNIGENVWNGLLSTGEFGGYNLNVELPTLSGGSILFDIINHMDLKIYCLDPNNAIKPECEWMGKLKYYAYSARGTTVGALLAVLEAKKDVIPDDVPEFAATIAIELWRDTSNQYEIKIKYRAQPDGKIFEDITRHVDGCPVSYPCPYETFKSRSQKFNPGNIEALCGTRAPYVEASTTPSGSSNKLCQSVLHILGFLFASLLILFQQQR